MVRDIIRCYQKKYQLGLPYDSLPMKKAKSTPVDLKLEERIKLLETELRMSKLKVEALETMIDIAEDQIKIDIRKKSGTQR